MAKEKSKIKIMVGSTVYGFEDQLSQIVAQLNTLGYDVLNSFNGSVKVNNSVNGFIQIALFTDRTEMSNYGGLPEGLSVKDLKIEHSSILRNPDIAQICFIRKYIEMLGSGTLRMIKDCRKNGFKSPVWVNKNNIIKLTFPGVSPNKKSEGVNERVKLRIEGVNEGVEKELIEILTFLGANPERRVPEIAEHLGKGISTIERYLKILKEKDLIEFIGALKTGGYQIKKQK